MARKEKYYTTKAESLKFTCCLCGAECTGWGNNPYPCEPKFGGDRCCDECNSTKVIPARLRALCKGEK